jgi:hypothetical protein
VNGWLQALRRKRLVLLGAAVALLLAASMVSSLLRSHGDGIFDAIRKQGYPVAMSELDAYYPSVPGVQNAALVYTNAFGLLTNLGGSTLSTTNALPRIGQRLSAEQKGQVLDLLEENEGALLLIYSVPASWRSRYDVRLADGYNAMLPHLGKTKEAVTLLSAEGLMHASDGDAEKATRAFLAAAQVAESLADEPTIVSQLVRYADWFILVQRLERALSLTRFTDGQLASLQQMLEVAERPRAMARAMAAERVCGLSLMTDTKMAAMTLTQQGGNRRFADVSTEAGLGLYRASGLQAKDKAFYADRMARHIAALELPYPARAAVGQQVVALTNQPGRFCFFSRMLLPALVTVHGKDARHVANLRIAAAALAIERFRLAHAGALPGSLQELVPTWCPSVATDPFGGKPLRYKTQGSSYAVYSIGGDGQDDGGVNWDSNYTKVPQDVAFVVKH